MIILLMITSEFLLRLGIKQVKTNNLRKLSRKVKMKNKQNKSYSDILM